MSHDVGAQTRRLVYVVVIILALAHQDFWLWDDASLWFGFMPAGLAYHALYSIVVAGVWALVVRYAWPTDVEEFAELTPPAS